MALSLFLILCSISASAQNERSLTRKGTRYARAGEWKKADEKFTEAIIKKPGMPEATYNFGFSLYNQEKYEEAAGKFADAANFTKDTLTLYKAYYNKGNALLKQDKYPESIDSYKQALRLKPGDSAAQYNLTYALMKMRDKEKQDQNQQQQKNNQQNKQDQNQKQEKEQEQKEQEQQQQQQPKPQNMTKEQAEKMLEALRREEQKLQEQKNKEKKKGALQKSEKDW